MNKTRIGLAGCVAAGLLFFAGLARATAPAGRYTTSMVNRTVYDHVTGLMWQRSLPSSTYDWLGALSYCEGLSLAGHSDWRLPNLKELQTIVDASTYNPAIDTAAFPGTPATYFWSSTPYPSSTAYSRAVDFGSGGSYTNLTTNLHEVRCVR